MSLQSKIIEAKLQIGLIEGAVRYVTTKGRIKPSTVISKSESIAYKIYVKEGKVYVEDSKGKQIEPKRKSVSRVRKPANEKPSKVSE